MKPIGENIVEATSGIKKLESDSSIGKKMRHDPFVEIKSEDLLTVIPILKNRLPRSAHVYNAALMAHESPSMNGMKGYILNGDLSGNAIIVLIFFREDFGQDVNISVPLDFDYKSSDPVKQAFITSSIINWDEKYMFAALDRLISPMIVEISTIHKGNSTLANPNFYYYMSQEDAAALEIKTETGVEVKPLDLEKGMPFLLGGWKYTRPGTEEYVRPIIENGWSSGIYLNGIPASGIITNLDGLTGLLFTGKSYRGKGYAITAKRFILKQMGMKGLVGATGIEYKNVASQKFHDRLGMTFSHICDYIMYEKNGFESKK